VELGLLDVAGGGALSPLQLLLWLEQHAPLAACSEALVAPVDWCTAVAARLLLLHGRRGRLLIRDLAACPEAHELSTALHSLEAAVAAAAAIAAAIASDPVDGLGGGGCAASLAAALRLHQGWFSPGAVAALRQRFAELDGDGDGLLSQEEFAR
jgi:hypothetical protein